MIIRHNPAGPGFMTRYTVQFKLPVDNPVSNVSMRKGKGFVEFEVPINHPDAHTMGFQQLLAAAELSGIFHISTPLNNRVASVQGKK